MAATAGVRAMFDMLERGLQPDPADPAVLARLKAGAGRREVVGAAPVRAAGRPVACHRCRAPANNGPPTGMPLFQLPSPAPWHCRRLVAATTAPTPPLPGFSHDVSGERPNRSFMPPSAAVPPTSRAPRLPVGRATPRKARDSSIRVDTTRLDQVLNLVGRNRPDQEPPERIAHGHPQRPCPTPTPCTPSIRR
jgi:hypothetical protein